MSKKTMPAQAMGKPPVELPEETKNAIEAAVIEAEAKTPIQEQAPADVQALRQEVEILRAQVAKAPQSLEDQINYFQKKQALVTRLHGLNASIANLQKYGEEIRKEAEEDIFSSEVFALRLSSKRGYSSEDDIFKFRNPVVIMELLTFVLEKMKQKREAIEMEIAA